MLGGVPDGGDSREAMADLEKAHELAPQNLGLCYDLARMYIYQGRRRKAIAILREAEKLPAVTGEDLVILRTCRKLLPPLLRADARRQKRRLQEGRNPKPPVSLPSDSSQMLNDTTRRRQ